jgi:hypothetical protein
LICLATVFRSLLSSADICLGIGFAEHDVFTCVMAVANRPDTYHILIRVVSHSLSPSLPVGPVMSAEAIAKAPPPTAARTLLRSVGDIIHLARLFAGLL